MKKKPKRSFQKLISLLNTTPLIQSKLARDEYAFFRELVVEMILGTDLAKHFEMMGKLPSVQDYRHCLCMALHCADVSNCARPLDISIKWTERLVDEFFHQGDLEAGLGLPVTPMMDRKTANVGRIQVGFIDVICRPLFVHLGTLVAADGLKTCLDYIEGNRQHWLEMGCTEETDANPPHQHVH